MLKIFKSVLAHDIKIGKKFQWANFLAYLPVAMEKTSFITLTPGVNDIKLFSVSLMLKIFKSVLAHDINIGKNCNGQTH
jgi:hypothetical protein